MTRQPWTIRRNASLAQAREMMRIHHIRHLPVLDGGKLVGVLSERELRLIDALPGGEPDEISVEDAMTADVYTVRADDPVDEVVDEMAEHKYGSVVVVDKSGTIEGIFTTVDALDVLAALLRRDAD
jgi:acetoin utilization protein AcuB